MTRDVPQDIEPHYTTRQTAKLTGYTSGALRNLRINNKGPVWIVTADGTVRYPHSAIVDWLSGKKRKAA